MHQHQILPCPEIAPGGELVPTRDYGPCFRDSDCEAGHYCSVNVYGRMFCDNAHALTLVEEVCGAGGWGGAGGSSGASGAAGRGGAAGTSGAGAGGAGAGGVP